MHLYRNGADGDNVDSASDREVGGGGGGCGGGGAEMAMLTMILADYDG